VISYHRAAAERLRDLDPVTEGLFLDHLAQLEQYQWFVRAHLQDAEGEVVFRHTDH
jgi:starvation-inducible DNA-binding protein